MIASPSGPQLTPSGQMSGPIRSIGKILKLQILFILIKTVLFIVFYIFYGSVYIHVCYLYIFYHI